VVWRRVAVKHDAPITAVDETTTMRGLYRPAGALAALLLGVAQAQTVQAAPVPEPVPEAVPRFEGAIGLVLGSQPAYSGSSQTKIKPELAGFVRYGRFTLTGAGGFTTRRQDEVERGLDAELVRREGLRVNLALRFDPGRRESVSDQLDGMGDIRPTLRSRVGLRWEPLPRWQLSAGASADVLGRGGGLMVDAGLSRSFVIDAHQRFGLGVSLSAANARYLQTWYGVTPAQSASSGYAVYEPRSGLRDIGASATWRIEIDPQWAAFTGLGVGRLLGPAADSPLTKRSDRLSLSAGIARRF
jgi:MipA family protein